jgi:alanyl-tRNA synthetase
MALFGEKYGETVRTITIRSMEDDRAASAGGITAAAATPTSPLEQHARYSYELCGGTHLDRTSDVGMFLIVAEGSAAAGVRRIEAVTGRGAYALVRRRFRTLEEASHLVRSSVDELPARLESLESELADARKDTAELRKARAMTIFDSRLESIKKVGDVQVLALDIPNADIETLRALGDRFRERYPKQAVAILAAAPILIAVVTSDLVKRGLKGADLIAAIGGRGGGRPGLAQGSLPQNVDLQRALSSAYAEIGARIT